MLVSPRGGPGPRTTVAFQSKDLICSLLNCNPGRPHHELSSCGHLLMGHGREPTRPLIRIPGVPNWKIIKIIIINWHPDKWHDCLIGVVAREPGRTWSRQGQRRGAGFGEVLGKHIQKLRMGKRAGWSASCPVSVTISRVTHGTATRDIGQEGLTIRVLLVSNRRRWQSAGTSRGKKQSGCGWQVPSLVLRVGPSTALQCGSVGSPEHCQLPLAPLPSTRDTVLTLCGFNSPSCPRGS